MASSPAAATPLVVLTRETPFGSLAVVISPEDGVVRASGFGSTARATATLPTDLHGRGWREGTDADVSGAIDRWLAGDADALAQVPAAQAGGEFMQSVWAAIRAIPGGQTATYGEMAAAAGNPRAARAAGHACATNALAPFVPCHRVVAANGLGNYGFGVDVKAAMLALEGAEGAEVSRTMTGRRRSGDTR